MGTVILGSPSLWAPVSDLGLFSKEISQAKDLGNKPLAFISGAGVKSG